MNKEIIKEFLKPDWRKILLIIIFSLGLITLFPENPWLYISWEGTDCKGIIVTGGCTIYKGLPFPYETTTSTITENPNVTMLRNHSLSLMHVNPTIKPISVEVIPPNIIVIRGGNPILPAKSIEAYAPTPKNTACPREA